jgi:hypothetical protein
MVERLFDTNQDIHRRFGAAVLLVEQNVNEARRLWRMTADTSRYASAAHPGVVTLCKRWRGQIHLPVRLRYSAIAFLRSSYSSQGTGQIVSRAVRCSSAFVRSFTIKYASPRYSCAPR